MASSLIAVLACAPLAAQWISYPTPGVPRTSDGKPNLQAPAPRANGKPDLSGVWQLEPRPCVPNGVQPCEDYVAGPEFFDLGARLKGGIPYQPWAKERVQKNLSGFGENDPVALCKPGGIARVMTYPQYRKFVQLPGLFIVLSERETTFRQIFMDGRPLPADPNPSWLGYSVGKWQDDTLVVETNGFRDDIWLDRNGSPLTSVGKVTEKFRRVNYGNLEVEMTIDDSKAYTAPWTVKLHYLLVPDTDLLEYHCDENEKDVKHFVGQEK